MTLITNNTVKVFQMQCSNIKKLGNDRGLILERKYDLLCRNIANGEVKSKIPVEEEECIADRTWHACNVTCWNSGYKNRRSRRNRLGYNISNRTL